MYFTIFFYTMWSTYSPFNTTWIVGMMSVVFPFLGIVNGYVSAKFYKFFNGTNWIGLSCMASTAVSGFFTLCLLAIYLAEFLETDRLVVSEILVYLLTWLFFNVFFTLFGTYLGFREKKIEVANKPTRMKRKERNTEDVCWVNPLLCFMFCSVLPFIVISAQFYFIFTSI